MPTSPEETPISDIMCTTVLTVEGSLPVGDVVRLMDREKIGAVMVTEDRKVAGIFTERDLLHRVVANGLDPTETLVASVTTRHVYSAAPGDSVRIVLDKMYLGNFRHLPIMQDGKLVGIVSMRDLLSFYADR